MIMLTWTNRIAVTMKACPQSAESGYNRLYKVPANIELISERLEACQPPPNTSVSHMTWYL